VSELISKSVLSDINSLAFSALVWLRVDLGRLWSTVSSARVGLGSCGESDLDLVGENLAWISHADERLP
jgi:hypothetical protein